MQVVGSIMLFKTKNIYIFFINMWIGKKKILLYNIKKLYLYVQYYNIKNFKKNQFQHYQIQYQIGFDFKFETRIGFELQHKLFFWLRRVLAACLHVQKEEEHYMFGWLIILYNFVDRRRTLNKRSPPSLFSFFLQKKTNIG